MLTYENKAGNFCFLKYQALFINSNATDVRRITSTIRTDIKDSDYGG